MKIKLILLLLASYVFFVTNLQADNDLFLEKEDKLYENLAAHNEALPAFEVFQKALTGYRNLAMSGAVERKIITVIDFSLSSNKKRMWVIDLENNKVLHHTLVAHGRNTGNEFAQRFSNIPESHQSSLGFYVTGKTYYGKHGLSLYLNGLEQGFNDKARDRAIVMHGADYATASFARKYGRLGRSYGCPSVPMDQHKKIINTIKDKSVLFIFYPDKDYMSKSVLLNAEQTDS